jgi:hypothetical protein
MRTTFDCPQCGTSHHTPASLQNRLIVAEPGTTIPCPDCRYPIPIELIAGGREEPTGPVGPPNAFGAFMGGVFGGLIAAAFLQVVLWFVLGFDVAAWGAIPLGGFRVPLLYPAMMAVFFLIFFMQYKRNAGAAR